MNHAVKSATNTLADWNTTNDNSMEQEKRSRNSVRENCSVLQ